MDELNWIDKTEDITEKWYWDTPSSELTPRFIRHLYVFKNQHIKILGIFRCYRETINYPQSIVSNMKSLAVISVLCQKLTKLFTARKPAWRNGYRFWLLIKGFRVRIPAWVSVAALAHLGERQTEEFLTWNLEVLCSSHRSCNIFFGNQILLQDELWSIVTIWNVVRKMYINHWTNFVWQKNVFFPSVKVIFTFHIS